MSRGFDGRTLLPLGSLCGAALAMAVSLAAPAEQLTFKVGLPDLPMHVPRDALRSLFLFLLGAASAAISVFAAGYFRRGHGTAPGLLCLQYQLFLVAVSDCPPSPTRILQGILAASSGSPACLKREGEPA